MQHHVIIVIDPDAGTASRLEEELVFMDESNVCVASIDGWRDCCAGRPVEAFFIGPGVPDRQLRALLDGVREVDPRVPIVQIGERSLAA